MEEIWRDIPGWEGNHHKGIIKEPRCYPGFFARQVHRLTYAGIY